MPNPKHPRRACLACGDECKTPQAVYCSLRCQADHRYEQTTARWLAGEIEGGTSRGLYKWARRWIIADRGEKCEQCDWAERNLVTGNVPLEVDHVVDCDDHRPENLKVLCPNCHSLTPTYRALNKGNGRSYRRASKA
jgi:hypothetical protein